jgi:hypothetical protein
VLGRFSLGPFLLAALASLVVLVHEVILVAEFIFANCNVAEGSGEGMLGRRLEVLEKRFECRCTIFSLAFAALHQQNQIEALHC